MMNAASALCNGALSIQATTAASTCGCRASTSVQFPSFNTITAQFDLAIFAPNKTTALRITPDRIASAEHPATGDPGSDKKNCAFNSGCPSYPCATPSPAM